MNNGELPNCDYNTCGNGTLDSGEQCDGGSHCENCQITPYCGDGNVDSGEDCDGGSNCDSNCHITYSCGDGTVNDGEECDDGNTANDDGCDSACEVECGDNQPSPL